MNRNKRSIGLSLATSFLCAATLSACKHSEPEAVQEPVQVISPSVVRVSADAMSNLKFASADMTDFPETLSVMGKVSPTEDRMSVVPARAAGRIESVLVASGETVQMGQELGNIFSPDFIAAREEYLQSVRQEKNTAQRESSKGDFRNLAQLAYKKLESLGLSKQDIEKLSANESAAGTGSTTVENLVIRASRSGAVITKNAIVGNQVNQGDPLFMIADLHQVWFLGDLYPEDVRKVKKNQEVILDVGAGKTLTGKVSFISPVVDPNTRTIKIRALIDNPDLTLRSDMYLQGGVVMSHQKALLVPSTAILRDNNMDFVFKAMGPLNVEGHTSGVDIQKMKVTIAGDRLGMTAVVEGLGNGDHIVSDGALLLNAALANSGK